MKETPTRMRKVTKADIYKILIRLHKWTFDEIANLNPFQQLLAAEVDVSDTGPDVLEFASLAEYNRWKAESRL